MSTYFTHIRQYISNSMYFSRSKFAKCIKTIKIDYRTQTLEFIAKTYKNRRVYIENYLIYITVYMKKIILGGIMIYTSLLVVWYAQMIVPDSQNYILNENNQQVLNTENISDPLRNWAYNIINPVSWTGTLSGVVWVGDQISSHQNAQRKVMAIIKNIINYALWMLALVALVYLIYHGFLIVTAAGDDTQYKKGISGVKYAAIAIAGIGASWLIVSAIFWVLALMIWP